jgi:hypothetical protein
LIGVRSLKPPGFPLLPGGAESARGLTLLPRKAAVVRRFLLALVFLGLLAAGCKSLDEQVTPPGPSTFHGGYHAP